MSVEWLTSSKAFVMEAPTGWADRQEHSTARRYEPRHCGCLKESRPNREGKWHYLIGTLGIFRKVMEKTIRKLALNASLGKLVFILPVILEFYRILNGAVVSSEPATGGCAGGLYRMVWAR